MQIKAEENVTSLPLPCPGQSHDIADTATVKQVSHVKRQPSREI